MAVSRSLPALVLAAVLCAGATAQAREDRDSGSTWRLSLEANTDFPLNVGARVGAELPGRLRLSTSVGWLPRAYLQGINDVAVDTELYDRRTADLIEDGLQGAIVWRTHVGWRPFSGSGFYIDGGYGLVTLGGASRPGEVLTALLGVAPPFIEDFANQLFEVRSTVHMVDAELGWQWYPGERLTVRAALGGAFTFAASSSIEPESDVGAVLLEPFTALAESKLNRTYKDYVHLPTLSLSVGYVF